MEIIKKSLKDAKLTYPIDKLFNRNEILFIDIETTGFTARTSKLYLIGCVYYEGDEFKTIQFFANKYEDEKRILEEFFLFSKGFKTLIHFNGNNFDIPYILDKCREHGINENFDSFEGIDIFKRVQPLKSFLKLENCKQKTIEKFLKIDRDDKYSGGDLIGIYHDYVKTNDEFKKQLLLLHNFDDISGMLNILPILAYCDLFSETIKVTKVSLQTYKDINANDKTELLMAMELPCDFITPISYVSNGFYFTGASGQAMLRVPVYEGELKYFFANYKDYYYLPDEDMALHKSVSSFVDTNKREQCKASNCYIRKESRFLPEFDTFIEPFFKTSYEDKFYYFELTDDKKTDRKLFSDYATHILTHIV